MEVSNVYCFLVMLLSSALFGQLFAADSCCNEKIAVNTGSMVNMSSCITTNANSSFKWTYKASRSNWSEIETIYPYLGNQTNPKFAAEFDITFDVDTNQSILHLRNASLASSGLFKCLEIAKNQISREKTIDVTVLEAGCWISDASIFEGNSFEEGCDVKVSGTANPVIQCPTSAEITSEPSIETNSDGPSVYRFRQKITASKKLSGTSLSCNIHVNWSYDGGNSDCVDHVHSKDKYVWSWTSPTLHLAHSSKGVSVQVVLIAVVVVLMVCSVIVTFITTAGRKRKVHEPETMSDSQYRGYHEVSHSLADVSTGRRQFSPSTRMYSASSSNMYSNYDDVNSASCNISLYAEVNEPTPPLVPPKNKHIDNTQPEVVALYADLEVTRVAATRPLRKPPLQSTGAAMYAPIDHTLSAEGCKENVDRKDEPPPPIAPRRNDAQQTKSSCFLQNI